MIFSNGGDDSTNTTASVERRHKRRDLSNRPSSWSERLLIFVRKHCPDASSQSTIALGSALAVLVLISYRKRNLLKNAILSMVARPAYCSATEAPLSFVYRQAREGRVNKALLSASTIYFLSNGIWRKSTLPTGSNTDKLQKDLIQALQETCPDLAALPESLLSRAATPLLAALPFVYLALVYRMMNNLNGNSGLTVNSSSAESAGTGTTFRDVAGMDHVVQEVAEVVSYLRDPTMFRRLGAVAPRAILLHGPPGTGKTLLAQAVAGESDVDCFVACSASSFVELYVGRGAARVRSLFAQARQQALASRRHAVWWSRLWPHRLPPLQQHQQHRAATAILFIDELDALAKTRSSHQFSSNDEREQTLNQLLTEMDGFDRHDQDNDETKNVTLIVIAATNRADVLDPAILRRFERHVHVGYPDTAGRLAILQIHAKRIRVSPVNVDWNALARDTDGFSGADIRNLVNEAAILAVREDSAVVEQHHLDHAVRRIREMKKHQSEPDLSSMMPLLFR